MSGINGLTMEVVNWTIFNNMSGVICTVLGLYAVIKNQLKPKVEIFLDILIMNLESRICKIQYLKGYNLK